MAGLCSGGLVQGPSWERGPSSDWGEENGVTFALHIKTGAGTGWCRGKIGSS